jgi:hypothetical protein
VSEVAIRLRRSATDLRAVPMTGMIASARAVKRIAREEAATVSGGDGKLNGKKRRGIMLRVRDEIKTTGTGATCRVQGSPAPWVWVTDGTRPHTTRRRKRGPLKVMIVNHPGSRGKGAWRTVRARSVKVVPAIFRDEVRNVMP